MCAEYSHDTPFLPPVPAVSNAASRLRPPATDDDEGPCSRSGFRSVRCRPPPRNTLLAVSECCLARPSALDRNTVAPQPLEICKHDTEVLLRSSLSMAGLSEHSFTLAAEKRVVPFIASAAATPSTPGLPARGNHCSGAPPHLEREPCHAYNMTVLVKNGHVKKRLSLATFALRFCSFASSLGVHV